MATKDVDKREIWRKLLDPIRDCYGMDFSTDLELLHHVVHDFQVVKAEHLKLSRIVQEQARLLRKAGIGGY